MASGSNLQTHGEHAIGLGAIGTYANSVSPMRMGALVWGALAVCGFIAASAVSENGVPPTWLFMTVVLVSAGAALWVTSRMKRALARQREEERRAAQAIAATERARQMDGMRNAKASPDADHRDGTA